MKRLALLSLVLFVAIATTVTADIHYAGPGSGTIGAAIIAASSGDTIVLSPGVYTGQWVEIENSWIWHYAIDPDILGGKSLTFRSTDPNNPSVVASTVIYGYQPPVPTTPPGDHLYMAAGAYFKANSDCRLEGLTFVSGFIHTPPRSIPQHAMAAIYCDATDLIINKCRFTGGTLAGEPYYPYEGYPGDIPAIHFISSDSLIENCTISIAGLISVDTWPTHYDGISHAVEIRGEDNINSNITIRNSNISNNRKLSDIYVNGTGTPGNAIDLETYYSSLFGYETEGSLTIENCTISGNDGTGVYERAYDYAEGNATITDCNISENGRGAVVLSGPIGTDINNCIINNNSSITDGGGILIQSPVDRVVSIDNCTLIGNIAGEDLHDGGRGGAIGVSCNGYGTETTINKCTIIGNDADDGGGIFVIGAGSPADSITIKDCEIIDNSTISGGEGGGGILNYSAVMTVVDCIITENKANGDGSGGGIRSTLDINVINCQITDNYAEGGGGGICGTDVDANNCVITGNNASGGSGGGIYGTNVDASNCVITGNNTSGGGGGIYGTNVDANNCMITGNDANNGDGGGIRSRTVGIKSCMITGNSANGDGGGVYALGSQYVMSDIINSTIAGNSASLEGGGAYINYTNVINSTIADNFASIKAGGVYLEGTSTVTNNIFWGNEVSDAGSHYSQIGVRPIYGGKYGIYISYCDIQDVKSITDDYGNVYIVHADFDGDYGYPDGEEVFGRDAGGNIIPAQAPDFTGDYHLNEGSPCIDSGDNSVVDWPFDIDGDARIIESVVDMGADEFIDRGIGYLVGTSTSAEATKLPHQRAAFYAPDSGRHWIFYYISGNYSANFLVYRSSADGVTWSDETTIEYVSSGARNCSVYFDGTYVHYTRFYYVYGGPYRTILYRRGAPASDGTINWSAPEQIVVYTASNYDFDTPNISVDSDGHAWIGLYQGHTAASYTRRPVVFKNANNDGTWSTASGFPYELKTNINYVDDWKVTVVPLTAGKVYVTYASSYIPESAYGRLWNGSSWEPEETVFDWYLSLGYGYSAVAEGDDVHFVYFCHEEAPYGIYYVKRTYGDGWGDPICVSEDSAPAMCPVLSIDKSTGTLYCFWTGAPTANHVYYKKCVSGVWDTDPIDWLDESTDTFATNDVLTCFERASDGRIGLSYTTKTSSPYNLKYAYLYVDTESQMTTNTVPVEPSPDAYWWKLDEANGITAYDSVGDDDGTFNGDDPCWVDGLIGGAIECNGVNDYFSVSSLDTAYYFGDTFSVAGWFKTSQSTGMQTIVGAWCNDKLAYGPTLYFGWQVLVENNKVVARFGAAGNPSDITASDVNDVNDGEWHHFALVYPTSDSNATLYVDGNSAGTPGPKTFYPNNTKFRIGDGSYVYAPNGGTATLKGGLFCGTIDDVMIFNEELSAEEVLQLYQRGQ